MSAVTIVGCGPGSRDYASAAALRAIAEADVVIGARRLIDELARQKTAYPFDGVARTLRRIREQAGKRIAVLVSGDPGFHSLTACIVRELGTAHVTIVPGISAMTYAFARLGLAWHEARLVSAHSTMPPDLTALVGAHGTVGILASPANPVSSLVAGIDPAVARNRRFVVCERLSYPDERLTDYAYEQVLGLRTDPLTVLIITQGRVS
jgi:precorrin-6y C5,15-methyltransferase (decarboxylating) CbiE subunit